MLPAVWLLVAAAATSISLALGLRQTFGLFLLPLAAEAGLSPTVLGGSVALHNLMWGVGQPVAGALADRYGAGRVMAGGGLLLAAGLALPALLPAPATALLGIGVLTGLGVAGAGTGTALAAVGRAVTPERRGEMIGLASAGGSLGQAALVPAAQGLIGGFGALAALGVLAAVMLAVLPVSRLVEWRPPAGAGAAAGARPPLFALARTALADRDFALLTAGFFACGFQLAFLTTHLPSHLSLCGMPVELGALG